VWRLAATDREIPSINLAPAESVIEAEVKNAVEENTICRDLPSARITASTLGENPTLMGALSLVLASKFAAHH